jgi:hypothetical protein
MPKMHRRNLNFLRRRVGASSDEVVRSAEGPSSATRSTDSRPLIVGIVLYAILLASFLIFSGSTVLKYTVVIMGVVLAAALPLLENIGGKAIRIALICLAVIGTAAAQFINDRANDAATSSLSGQLAAIRSQNSGLNRQLTELRIKNLEDTTLKQEQESREIELLDPRDTLAAAKDADRGFVDKASMLAFEASVQEAILLSHCSLSQCPAVLAFPDDPSERIGAWKRYLALSPAAHNKEMQDRIVRINDSLSKVAAYYKIAESFRQTAKPAYEDLLAEDRTRPMGFAELARRMEAVAEIFANKTLAYPFAGRDNQLGVIAMACRDKERALAYLYQGLLEDPQHIPLYQSLAYVFWVLNGDSHGALEYAEKGLASIQNLNASLDKDYDQAVAIFDRLAIEKMVSEGEHKDLRLKLAERYAKARSAGRSYSTYFTADFELQYAYYSALEKLNEKQARSYVDSLYRSNPNDGEYQDARGFVLMRFRRSLDEIDTARQMFQLAHDNPKSEHLTVELARKHLDELQKIVGDNTVAGN